MNKSLVSRRQLTLGAISLTGLIASGCTTTGPTASLDPTKSKTLKGTSKSFALNYAALPNEKFPIPAVSANSLPPKFRRKRVNYKTKERVGTLVVDTKNFYLYHVEPNGKATRYGVGLGRAGFEWSGRARVAWKRAWPTWTPPEEMIQREPELRKWSAKNGGMPPGIKNPLGSRALYIFQGNVDTLYRLHGTPNPKTIGKAVSSGCVRLVNQDVIHLFNNVKNGSKIVVT
ncbi:MAG: L,D-transpeptidase [Hyphomicrobiales bacterium]